ncbi:alpha/beta-hydrolase [Paramyrothecium foliicola]|nr:alpha/beta-hydrolase [Paramyrothecium foliicola]
MGNHISYHQEPYDLSLGDKGTIRGLQLDNKSRRFAGVPYALPPTGPNRWRRPQPLPKTYIYRGTNDGPYDATSFRAVCPQKAFHVNQAEGGTGAYSEDCLFVNIWTPVPREGHQEKWPVKLWIHGGWFQMGDPSQDPGMDPTEMISTGGLNAIVVAIGYRLNIFGFLAGEDVLKDNHGNAAGNFGLWDQRMAAEWVRENISLFGGDPDNVTLAGRSAGAYSAEALMLYEFRRPGPKDTTFRRIFMDSNAIPAQPKTLIHAQAQFDEVCSHFCIDAALSSEEKLAILRDVSVKDLVKAIPKLNNHTFRPVTDDLFIFSGMADYLRSTDFARDFNDRNCKILIGEVLNEETLYAAYNGPKEPTLEALRLQLSNYYAPDVVDRVLLRYQLPQSQDVQDWCNLFGRVVADGQVRAPSRALVNHLASNGVSHKNIWRYQIAYRLSFIDEQIAPMSFSICHGPTNEELRLMKDWINILVAFVNDDTKYEFGTTRIEEMKIAAQSGSIEVKKDDQWDQLLDVADVFRG